MDRSDSSKEKEVRSGGSVGNESRKTERGRETTQKPSVAELQKTGKEKKERNRKTAMSLENERPGFEGLGKTWTCYHLSRCDPSGSCPIQVRAI